ncbi:ribonuclease T2-like [Salmo trutta]|uniref:Ribonuclease T2, like n=1 Tax=Salmo trutta TaxID=8032 RepID=A0A673WNS3_SALTR|nr:ribonuclease Oy-like [Salmo trutta]XP_029628411.1 ribonuclease Oy-like [Salmo trutta]
MLSPVLLMVALLTVLTVTMESDHWITDQQEKFCTWQCLKFTLQWPGSFCLGLKNSSQCRIPPNIQTWTIHGLWPLKAHTCCLCWPIFHSDLKELDPELSQLWPSLLKTQSSFLFWKDEWIKHGSCAACVEGMNSPLRYFQICLKLRGRFDIDRALEDAGIKPSCNQSYPYDKVNHALAPVIGDDPNAQIQCINDEKEREVLVQVKIPLSQNLTLGCHHKEDQGAEPEPTQLWHTFPGHPCPQDSPVFYFPINHDRPHQPCD